MARRKQFCVTTGGGSGIGLAAARVIGKRSRVIIAGRTESKLHQAVEELRRARIDAQSFRCDVSDVDTVRQLAAFAQESGNVTAVIHSAGLSPTAHGRCPYDHGDQCPRQDPWQ